MKYKSEITGKEYNTEKECLDAEVAFQASQKKTDDEKQEFREKIALQNRLLNESIEYYRAVSEEQDKLIKKAMEKVREAQEKEKNVRENATQERMKANKKILEENEYLANMVYEYKNKYNETIVEKDGELEFKPNKNDISEILKALFDIC